MNSKTPQKQLLQKQSIDPDDIRSLFYDDETINEYMDLITKRSPDTVYAFSTYFYTTYITRGYGPISRWTKNINIFDKKKLFIPIHLENIEHWCLIYVDFEKRSINYYDSLHGRNFFCLKKIMNYLMFEKLYRTNEELSFDGYILTNVQDCPKQENSWDCGVFTCMFAEHLARDEPLKFTQEDMERFRKQINYEIQEKRLINCIL